MNILYLTAGDHVDYLNDCLLIGLKELFSTQVVDMNKQRHIYDSYDKDAAKKLYGKGMSVTRLIPDLEVDRTDINNKIKNRFFDFIIYGSIWRCSDHINTILEHYPKERVIVVDGEDETNIHKVFELGIPYFKRELIHHHDRLLPIAFSMPTTKINFNKDKIKDYSFITPRDTSTYIYNEELDYYKDYGDARLGETFKKAGWDCMRHYEIMGNGCLPLFSNLQHCPELTMTTFPKDICKQILEDIKHEKISIVYDKHIDALETYFMQHNTTIKAAELFISQIKSNI